MVIEQVFDTGAPYYLYYNLKEEFKKNYFKAFGDGNLRINKSFYNAEGIFDKLSLSFPLEEATKLKEHLFPTDEYNAVAVASDGLGTFVRQVKTATSITNKSLSVIDVVKGLFDFKAASGQFIHRRCQKLFRDYHSQGIRHNDDFSIGVLAP